MLLGSMIVLLALVPEAFGVQRWERRYRDASGFPNEGWDVIQTSDGGYFIAGMSGPVMWLVRTDSFGDTLWTRRHQPAGSDFVIVNAAAAADSGGFVIAGMICEIQRESVWCYVLAIDSAGDSLWALRYQRFPAAAEAFDIERTPDGGYALAVWQHITNSGPSVTILLKLNREGGVQWARQFDSVFPPLALKVTPDGGYVLSGTCHEQLSLYNGLVIRTDSLGDTLWTRLLWGPRSEEAFDVLALPDASVVLAGMTDSWGGGGNDGWLVKVGPQGRVQWSKTFGDGTGQCFRHIAATSDSGFILTGNTMSANAAWLVRTDSAGNLHWARAFGSLRYQGNSGCQTADGGFVFTGYANEALYLVKTGEEGSADVREEPGKSAPANGDGLSLRVAGVQRDELRVAYSVPEPGIVELTLVDVAGRRCVEYRHQEPAGGWREVTLPVSFATGVYVLVARVGPRTAVRTITMLNREGR